MTAIPNKLNILNTLRAHILDDDKDMNEVMKEVFDMAGFSNTEFIVEFFQESDGFLNAMNENIHLCIVDQVIKGSALQGIDVARILKSRFPNTKIIFVTGTDNPAVLKELVRIRPDGFIDKAEKGYLHRVVEAALDQLDGIRKNFQFANILSKYQTENEQ